MWNRETQFTALVKALSNDLYRYAFWLCRHREQAEDLVQETFARAWRAMDNLRDDRAARAWLLVTLRREHARLYERIRPAQTDIDPDSVPGLYRDLDSSTEAWALRRQLALLPIEYSEPLVLQVIGGYSGEEIASMLDLTPAAVTTRLFRARQQLRRALRADPEDLEVAAR
ncbi:MAG: sigma-70 family RNA polymerase sigma factor [Gammaproteobacteria bacterium]|nr:sigma-70 family RNA polymerase sigma factor [Gammaproteobacteria bacterium]